MPDPKVLTAMIPVHYLRLSLLILSTFFAFWDLGGGELKDWDEAYYGGLAQGMIDSGDWINYHTAGNLDTWNAKPPLYVILLSGVFSIFGASVWSLRLISALSVVGFIQISFSILKRYQGPVMAWLGGMILLGGKGIVGYHVGRGGDTDAFQVLLMAGFFYYFLLYVDAGKKSGIWWAALLIALAFWNKSVTAFFPLPGCFLYLLFRKRLLPSLREINFLGALVTGVGLIALWFWLSHQYGADYDELGYGENLLDTMVSFDIVARFGTEARSGAFNWDFLIVYLDTKFNLWYILFYLTLVILGYRTFKAWKNGTLLGWYTKPYLPAFALFTFPLIGLVLVFSESEFAWYMAPYLLLILAVTLRGIELGTARYPCLKYLVMILLAFSLGRRAVQLYQEPQEGGMVYKSMEMIAEAPGAGTLGHVSPSNLFRLITVYPNVYAELDPGLWDALPQDFLYLHDGTYFPTPSDHFELIECEEKVSLYRKIK